MSVVDTTKNLRPIEICPNGHHYNTKYTGDICGVCGTKLDAQDGMTDDELRELVYVDVCDRVCAWLICIEGPSSGHSYEIKTGKNYIGSAGSMDIRVLGDPKIEKRNHAVIAYDSKEMNTTLLPGESRGMIYWQEKAIYAPTELTEKQRIRLGDSVFKFVPFCDDDFAWTSDED